MAETQPPEMVTMTLSVNGEPHTVSFPAHHTLLEVLRERLHLCGTKHGCELGECGTCTVLLEGEPVLSCLVLATDAEGADVETVEGLHRGGELHPLQETFADMSAAQCGYCTPGMLMASKWLLERKPDPSDEEVAECLSGNLCRCTGYHKITQAVQMAARMLREGGEAEPKREWIYGESAPQEAPHE